MKPFVFYIPGCAVLRPQTQIFSLLKYVLVCHRLPLCSLRVLFIVERTATAYVWNFQEIVRFRRGFGIPFQSIGIPRIGTGRLTTTKRDNEVPDEYEDGDADSKGANRSNKVQFIPTQITGIRIDAPWHAKQSHDMHREESQVHTY